MNRGFASIALVIVAFAVVIAGVGGWWYVNQRYASSTGATSMNITSPATGANWVIGKTYTIVLSKPTTASWPEGIGIDVILIREDSTPVGIISSSKLNGGVLKPAVEWNTADKLLTCLGAGCPGSEVTVRQGRYKIRVVDNGKVLAESGTFTIKNSEGTRSNVSAPDISKYPPTIGTIAPMKADPNTLITVKGSNFSAQGAPTIDFLKRMSDDKPFASFRLGDRYGDYISPDGILLQFIPAAHDEVARIPSGAYEVRYSNNGAVSGPGYFALTGPQPSTPVINDVSVTEGMSGWIVVVFGSGFTSTSTITVNANGRVMVLSQDASGTGDSYQISALLPANTCTQANQGCSVNISVQVTNGNSVSNTVEVVNTRG